MTDELQRQININIQLRKQLERCRRDVVEYCAKFCEDNEMSLANGKYISMAAQDDRKYTHSGDGYAKGLRDIIGK